MYYIFTDPRPLSESSAYAVGAMDDDGIVYNDPTPYCPGRNCSAAIGLVDTDGYVYSDPNPYSRGSYGSSVIGFVDEQGYIYTDPRPYLRGPNGSGVAGFVDSDGYVYTDPSPYLHGPGSSSVIGKVSGDVRRAGAALLLLQGQFTKASGTSYSASASYGNSRSYSAGSSAYHSAPSYTPPREKPRTVSLYDAKDKRIGYIKYDHHTHYSTVKYNGTYARESFDGTVYDIGGRKRGYIRDGRFFTPGAYANGDRSLYLGACNYCKRKRGYTPLYVSGKFIHDYLVGWRTPDGYISSNLGQAHPDIAKVVGYASSGGAADGLALLYLLGMLNKDLPYPKKGKPFHRQLHLD